jgi:hypothetical protein
VTAQTVPGRETSFGRGSPSAKISQPIRRTRRQVQPAPDVLLRARTSSLMCAMKIKYNKRVSSDILSPKRKWTDRQIARAKNKDFVISLALSKDGQLRSFKPQMSTRGCDRLDCGGREYACSRVAWAREAILPLSCLLQTRSSAWRRRGEGRFGFQRG